MFDEHQGEIMDSNLDYDFIVIGSGFGGSVAALRLAEKGYRVAVIEKGKRYRNEDFPKTNWDFKKSIWMPLLGLTGIQGLTLLRHVLVLHGNGVGGGSLVYANQLIIPDDEVLQKPEWGPGDWKTTLEPHYKEAGRMLGAVECPGVGNADLVLREVGKEICDRDTFHVNPVGIYFGKPDEVSPDPYFGGQGPERKGCTLCGACMIGCPVGAKNTTDKNYLYLAEKLGVQVIPETEVLGVQAEGNHYRVMTRKSHGLQQTQKTYLCGGAEC
jgi:cholesterol oxidase